MAKLSSIIDTAFLLLVPASLLLCALWKLNANALITYTMVFLSFIPIVIRFEKEKLKPRELMPIVVLSAIAAAGRVAFALFPNVKPTTAIIIVAGVCLGKNKGFIVGMLSALCSNLFFGQGAHTPWQMYAWGVIGYLAGYLAEKNLFRQKWTIYPFGFMSGILFGFIMDSWTAVSFISPLTLPAMLTVYIAGLEFTLRHSISTALFLVLIFVPWKIKIERVVKKYNL